MTTPPLSLSRLGWVELLLTDSYHQKGVWVGLILNDSYHPKRGVAYDMSKSLATPTLVRKYRGAGLKN